MSGAIPVVFGLLALVSTGGCASRPARSEVASTLFTRDEADARSSNDGIGVRELVPSAVEALPAVSSPPTLTLERHDGARDLACGLVDPMPGGFLAGYALDTGLDIASMPVEVFAIASGRVVYAEEGHTAWNGPRDSPFAVLVMLDAPLAHPRGLVTHVWYAHLESVTRAVTRDDAEEVRVEAGAVLGRSGRANGAYHLHLGMLLDGDTSQRHRTYLDEAEVRSVLCAAPPRGRLERLRAAGGVVR